jgi:hypothetical protein
VGQLRAAQAGQVLDRALILAGHARAGWAGQFKVAQAGRGSSGQGRA